MSKQRTALVFLSLGHVTVSPHESNNPPSRGQPTQISNTNHCTEIILIIVYFIRLWFLFLFLD
jgi:hypothetical protein